MSSRRCAVELAGARRHRTVGPGADEDVVEPAVVVALEADDRVAPVAARASRIAAWTISLPDEPKRTISGQPRIDEDLLRRLQLERVLGAEDHAVRGRPR